jgi:D-aspartate ligase
MKNFNKIKKLDFNKPVPVILGSFINALGLVRSFGEKGINSVVIDYTSGISFKSKYAVGIKISESYKKDEKLVVNFLIKIGKKLPKKGFFLSTNDDFLIIISKYRKILEYYYIYPMSEWSVIEKCIDKSKFQKAISSLDIPKPKSVLASSVYEVKEKLAGLNFPVVIKPTITIGFSEKMKLSGRTIILQNINEFNSIYERIIKFKCDNIPLIVQENIPGDPSSLYTITSYSNKNADIIAYSIGHKIRQYPPAAGTIISGIVLPVKEIYEISKPLIKSIGFHGIANTEFKFDYRDNKFKIIEINARPGKWNFSALKTGLNLPYIAYEEVALHKKSCFIGTSFKKIVWIETFKDLMLSIYGFKKLGYKKYHLSIKEWWKSIKGKKVDCLWSTKDPLPFFIYYSKMFFSWFKKIIFNIFIRKEKNEFTS